MLSRFKILYDVPITIGSYIKYRETTPARKGFGEVVGLVGSGERLKYEIINLNKRLKHIVDANHIYKRRLIHHSKCKHVDIKSTVLDKKHFELGDVVCHKRFGLKKYGAVVGFQHPDYLYTTSYEQGYNGVDLLDCVEINPRTLTRVRKFDKIVKFVSNKKYLKICEVDLWDEKGVLIK
jgi:hypothetical protein